jgi:excisionase family DNA binding protein
MSEGRDAIEGWLTTEQAGELTGYNVKYLRWLAGQGRVEARKVGRDWLISREDLLAYKREMERLGTAKHDPWRKELADRGRGRREVRGDH